MSELRKLTRMGGDVRKLAALLQAKAPKGHMLAYINPEEAAILKARGGSGEPHADTGIPSFEPDGGGFDTGGFEGLTQGQVDTAGQQQAAQPQISAGGSEQAAPQFGADIMSPYTSQAAPSFVNKGIPTDIPQFGQGGTSGEGISTTAFQPSATPPAETPTPDKGWADKLSSTTGLSKDTLSRLGLAGGLGLLGASTARRAQQSGQAGKQEMQALATPYQQAGQQAQAAAQRGELMPVGQQSLQAAQAQLNQQIQNRGGVGVQQAATQIEQLRQQLLQQQYDYGLKLSGIGDNIALGAIRTGLQADQYVNQLTNSFYSNMAYIASGMSPGIRVGGTQGATA
jgi:hypothetical protein